MRRRTDTRRRGPLQLQALYSVRALAVAAGVSPDLLLRLLRATKVELVQAGRSVFVPLVEIKAKIPALWNSILEAESQRRVAR